MTRMVNVNLTAAAAERTAREHARAALAATAGTADARRSRTRFGARRSRGVDAQSSSPIAGLDTTPSTRIAPSGAVAWHTGPAEVLYVASWWARFAAYLLDQILMSVVLTGGLLLVDVGEPDTRFIGTVVSGVIIYVLYNPLLVAFNHGQTLGKKLLGMRVINKDVTPTGLGRAVLRELVFKTLGSILSPFNLIDYLWAAAREDRRSLHDLGAGTVVVQA